MTRSVDSLIAGFAHKKVLVLGDLMLDEYLWGEVERISPEAPVPVVKVKRKTFTLGGAANVAANLSALGATVLLGGVLGADREADNVRAMLREHDIAGTGLLVDDTRPTTTKTRIVAQNQQLVRVDREHRGPIPRGLEIAMLEWIGREVSRIDVCLLSDYAKGLLSCNVLSEVFLCCRHNNVPVVVDPKGNDFKRYKHATLVTPNRSEALAATNSHGEGSVNISYLGSTLSEALPDSAVLITLGVEGVALFEPNHDPLYLPSVARQVYDVTGAGDTLVAALALCVASGTTLAEAAWFGNQAAGIVVGKSGTATVEPSELLNCTLELPSTVSGHEHTRNGRPSTAQSLG